MFLLYLLPVGSTTLDFDKNIVGQIDDQIDGGEKIVIRTVAIPARLPPVSARIAACRIS